MASSDKPISGGLPPALDQLTIDTPEQTPLEFPLAGIGSRFLALALDSLIQFVGILGFVVLAELLGIFEKRFWRAGGNWSLAILVFLLFLIYYGYFAIFEALWNGQTPGKRFAGIRVIKENGTPITAGDAASRNLLRLVDLMPGFYAVGILTALLNRQNKRLGDFVAGTVVVHENLLEGSEPAWKLKDARANEAADPLTTPAAIRLGAARLTGEELQLIETFLDRRESLTVEVRSAMARQIAERMGQRLAVPPEERRAAETFLELLARERRAAR